MESLGSDPWRIGDYSEKDETGRQVHIKIIRKYALTYWADHAVKEIKVTRVELADIS